MPAPLMFAFAVPFALQVAAAGAALEMIVAESRGFIAHAQDL